MTEIQGTILTSAGQPANGYLYLRQSTRFSTITGLVTTAVARSRVVAGIPYLDDGVTALTSPPTPEGQALEIVEDFLDGTTTTRYVSVPDAATVKYQDLNDTIPPSTSTSVPSWVSDVLAVPDAVELIKTQAEAARDAAAASAASLDVSSFVKTINGDPPDESGNVDVAGSGVVIGTTAGTAADAAAVAGELATKADLVSGVVPAGQLPSYVDDVLEFANPAALPNPGETGKIYVTTDAGVQWRWSGSQYIQLVASPGSTDAVPEGSANLYFTDARAQDALATDLAAKVPTSRMVNGKPLDADVDLTASDVGAAAQATVDADVQVVPWNMGTRTWGVARAGAAQRDFNSKNDPTATAPTALAAGDTWTYAVVS